MTVNEHLGKIAYEVRHNLERQDPRHYYEDIGGPPDPVTWDQLPALIQARYVRVGAAVKSALAQEQEMDDTELGIIAYEAFNESTAGFPQVMPRWDTLTRDAHFSFISASIAIKNAVLGIRPLPFAIVDAQ